MKEKQNQPIITWLTVTTGEQNYFKFMNYVCRLNEFIPHKYSSERFEKIYNGLYEYSIRFEFDLNRLIKISHNKDKAEALVNTFIDIIKCWWFTGADFVRD